METSLGGKSVQPLLGSCKEGKTNKHLLDSAGSNKCWFGQGNICWPSDLAELPVGDGMAGRSVS
jgi:hypothetical protein